MTTTEQNILLDASNEQLWIIRYVGPFNADDFRAHLQEADDVLQARPPGLPLGYVMDIDNAPPLLGDIRNAAVAFWKRNREQLTRDLVCIAYVCNKRWMRGAIIAFNWFSPLPAAFSFHSTVDEARAAAASKVEFAEAHS